MALLGENGAGKSTLSNIIAGVFPSDTGQMWWRGQPYAPTAPGDALDLGIGLIHQEMRLLPDLSISENVFVGRQLMKGGRLDRAEMDRRAREQLLRLGLDVPPTRLVRSLRVAAQQQVEIAKALALEARLLILDEPTAALGGGGDRPPVRAGRRAAPGRGLVHLRQPPPRGDRPHLRPGGRAARRRVGDLPRHRAGPGPPPRRGHGRPQHRERVPRPRPSQEREVLKVTGLTAADRSFVDVSFTVHEGEILGIAGIVGAGRTELVRAVAGADPVAAGTVEVEGRALKGSSCRDAIAAGVVLVPEDRKAQGVVLDMSIADNVAVAQPRQRRRPRRLHQPPAGPRRGRGSGQADAGQGPTRAARTRPVRREPAEGRHRQVAGAQTAAWSSSTSPPAVSTSAPGPRSTT